MLLPLMADTGVAVTVTLKVFELALHPVAVIVSFTETVLAPAVFQATVMLLVPCPEVIEPPAETVQVYPRPALPAVE